MLGANEKPAEVLARGGLVCKAGGAGRVVFGDEASDFINRRERCPGPLDHHESSTVFGEHRFDLLVACEFACSGLLDAFVNVTNLPGFTLHIVGQRSRRATHSTPWRTPFHADGGQRSTAMCAAKFPSVPAAPAGWL